MFSYTILGTAGALLARDAYYVLTFKNAIARAQSKLNKVALPEVKELPIARQHMQQGTYEQLSDLHEFAFARKPGFEAWFQTYLRSKTPFNHTSCAYSIADKWLVYGRQSPACKTISSEAQTPDLKRPPALSTMADNEIDYTLMETGPRDDTRTTFLLHRTGVYFTGAEIKQVMEKANKTICGDMHLRSGFNTFITSNCYTFSVYTLTQFIALLHEKQLDPKRTKSFIAEILKLYSVLLEACSHPYILAHGVGNNGPVREAVFNCIQIAEQYLLQLSKRKELDPDDRIEQEEAADAGHKHRHRHGRLLSRL